VAIGRACSFSVLHESLAVDYPHCRQPNVPAAAVTLSGQHRDAVGSFRQTEQVWQAWLRTLEIARALDARVILFQCPTSFLPTSENLINCSAFFRSVTKEFFRLAFEPRGEAWTEDIVREFCAEYDLLHCVDPFETTSVHGDIRYWRLHGRGSYSCRYTGADLARLSQMLAKPPQSGYLMFNNFSSKADALRFRKLSRTRCTP
jgi:uncharacterized protein YecE (DUF72 family)